jgi:hypothetical protein
VVERGDEVAQGVDERAVEVDDAGLHAAKAARI